MLLQVTDRRSGLVPRPLVGLTCTRAAYLAELTAACHIPNDIAAPGDQSETQEGCRLLVDYEVGVLGRYTNPGFFVPEQGLTNPSKHFHSPQLAVNAELLVLCCGRNMDQLFPWDVCRWKSQYRGESGLGPPHPPGPGSGRTASSIKREAHSWP